MKKKQVIIPEEDQTYRIFPVYKRKCDAMGLIPMPYIKELLDLATQASNFEILNTFQEIGPMHIRALLQAVTDIKYEKLKTLNLYKIKTGDEGVRAISKYLAFDKNSLETLDLIQNQLTSLGCEFLGKSLAFPFCRVKCLKLDGNLIGTHGLKNLTLGIRTNSSVMKLSLKYCGIDSQGAIYIQEILANISTKIRSLKLQGNNLGNKSIYDILRAVNCNNTLQKLNIADTGLNLLAFKPTVLKMLIQEQKIEQNDEKQEEENPQGMEEANKQPEGGNIDNVKQTIKLPQQNPDIPSKVAHFGKLQQRFPEQQPLYKISRTIEESDLSIEAELMRIFLHTFHNNSRLKKYDLRFNPICDDAAFMLFEAIEENPTIKDVEFNNNVDYELRQNLDTLMRRRTGRMPKGRKGKKGGKKKKGKKK